MKALKSELAKAVLADPKASAQLREFHHGKTDVVVEVFFNGKLRQYRPKFVPPAGR